MHIFSQIIRLITQPPGDLVYFLVTLFTLQQTLFPGLISRQAQANTPKARRWLWAAGTMLLGRLILMLIALLNSAGLIKATVLLPPLERWVALASIFLVMWAALFSKRLMRWQTILLVVCLLLSLVFYGYNMLTWPAQAAINVAYNSSSLAPIWELVCVLMLIVALILALILRPQDWEWAIAMFLFWGLGHGAQLSLADAQMHIAGWQRAMSLVVFPLLSILAHKQIFAVRPKLPQGILLPDSDALLTLMQDVALGRELETALMLASSRIAKLLNAEMCAIALISEDNEAFMRVVAVHPPNAAQLEAPALEWGAYATLYETYTAQKPGIAQPPDKFPWLEGLYRRLGFEHIGPLVVLPLYYQDQGIGLLLLGNPKSKRMWSQHSLEGQKLAAALLSEAIARARTQGKDRPLLERLRGEEASAAQPTQDETQWQAQVDALQQRVATLTREIKARDEEILQLNRELNTQDERVSQTELSFWQNEVRELSQDRDMLIEDRNRIATQLSDLKGKLDVVSDARDHLETQLQQTQRDLENAHKELETPTIQAAVGLIITDQNGQIVQADALARRMLRLPQGDVTGMPIDGAYPDPKWAKMIDELLSPLPDARRHARMTLKEFDSTIDAEAVTLSGRDGMPEGLIITLRMPESPAEQQETIVSVANEFRTPMTAIVGYTDLLMGEQAGILTEMQQQFLERVKANVEQLGHLLNDFISIASPDSRPIEITPQFVNLIEIIEEAVMGLAARFRERRLAVQLDLPPELSLVRADRDSLYQIMLRLLSNAALCSQEGSEVTVRASQHDAGDESGEYVRISVSDTGGGIDPDDYARVFRRFYRANQALVQGMGETGIGMAVAKTLVEANHGRIWVESQANIGSTFSFILPTNDNNSESFKA